VTLRRRLTVWYGALLAGVLAVALTLAYVLHVESHDADVDTAIADMTERATLDVVAELVAGTAPLEVRLIGLHKMIEESHALWLFEGTRMLDSAGVTDDPAFGDVGVAELKPGWLTSWTTSGRLRLFVAPIDGTDLRVVTAVTLAAVDASNAELRMALFLLALMAVGVGAAGGSAIAASALSPIARLTDTAAEIARSRDFSRRVRVEGDDEDELVRLGITFDEMLASLDDSYQQQQRFVGDVSHELRTPLTTIRGNAELLASGETSAEEQREAIDHIRREIERLSRLVDELLVLARADAVEAFAPRTVQLDEVLMETFADLRGVAGRRLRVNDIDAVTVSGERDRLKQLMLVLLDNALRYTPQGTVHASIGDDGTDAVLRIEDDGVGIAVSELPHVFERFYRGDAARRIDASGSGLGLPIARWIVERHGGQIRIESRPAHGTLVTVRIPLVRSGHHALNGREPLIRRAAVQ
jgi:two-component system OmpR family sensor kinase